MEDVYWVGTQQGCQVNLVPSAYWQTYGTISDQLKIVGIGVPQSAERNDQETLFFNDPCQFVTNALEMERASYATEFGARMRDLSLDRRATIIENMFRSP